MDAMQCSPCSYNLLPPSSGPNAALEYRDGTLDRTSDAESPDGQTKQNKTNTEN